MDWAKHDAMIRKYLAFINTKSDKFVLKGGSALHVCYNSPRISDDIDFDGFDEKFLEYSKEFCEENDIPYNIKKDTDTTKRIMLHHDDENCKPLKIETSYRNKCLPNTMMAEMNSVLTYTVNRLAKQKANAFQNRDKIRDIYDLCYIYDTYEAVLTEETLVDIQDAFLSKTPEDVLYMVTENPDSQIDSNKLFDDFCRIYEDVGIAKLDNIKNQVYALDELTDETSSDLTK